MLIRHRQKARQNIAHTTCNWHPTMLVVTMEADRTTNPWPIHWLPRKELEPSSSARKLGDDCVVVIVGRGGRPTASIQGDYKRPDRAVLVSCKPLLAPPFGELNWSCLIRELAIEGQVAREPNEQENQILQSAQLCSS